MTITKIERPNGLAPMWGIFQGGAITAAFKTEADAKDFVASIADHSGCDHLDHICTAN